MFCAIETLQDPSTCWCFIFVTMLWRNDLRYILIATLLSRTTQLLHCIKFGCWQTTQQGAGNNVPSSANHWKGCWMFNRRTTIQLSGVRTPLSRMLMSLRHIFQCHLWTLMLRLLTLARSWPILKERLNSKTKKRRSSVKRRDQCPTGLKEAKDVMAQH